MKKIAVIGGTGSGQLFDVSSCGDLPATTPFGPPSSALQSIECDSDRSSLVFLARHGTDGSIPPHRVNYRANLWSLRQVRPDFVVGINAVGGISETASPARLCFPDQLIDYTSGREHTFWDGKPDREFVVPRHIEFTTPFDAGVRRCLIDAAGALDLDFLPGGTYGVTQGPRLETAAEVDRLERDGCDIVGMTALPEAALARELGMAYAICAVVVNRAAGRGQPGDDIHAQMQRSIDAGMAQVAQLLRSL